MMIIGIRRCGQMITRSIFRTYCIIYGLKVFHEIALPFMKISCKGAKVIEPACECKNLLFRVICDIQS